MLPQLLLMCLPFYQVPDIPKETRLEIQQQVMERLEQDQKAIKAGGETAHQVIEANHKWLLGIVVKSGWIDAERFDSKAAAFSAIMLKHSHDLTSMICILPIVERDFKNPQEGQTFAIFYDGLMTQLGQKQRYGTQLEEGPDGDLYTLPIEDSCNIEQRWLELGVGPYWEYMEMLEKAFGKKAWLKDSGL